MVLLSQIVRSPANKTLTDLPTLAHLNVLHASEYCYSCMSQFYTLRQCLKIARTSLYLGIGYGLRKSPKKVETYSENVDMASHAFDFKKVGEM